MPVHIRIEGDAAVLSNFGRLMNDPAHFDASKDARELLEEGYRKFVLELAGVNEIGDSGIGLLMTITRQVRQSGGDVVLAKVSRSMERVIEEMRMDDYWEVFPTVDDALADLARRFHGRKA